MGLNLVICLWIFSTELEKVQSLQCLHNWCLGKQITSVGVQFILPFGPKDVFNVDATLLAAIMCDWKETIIEIGITFSIENCES